VGHRSLCIPSRTGVRRTLQHYAQCKSLAPEFTSAVFLLPSWEHKRWFRKATAGMVLVQSLSTADAPWLVRPGTSAKGTIGSVYYDSAVVGPCPHDAAPDVAVCTAGDASHATASACDAEQQHACAPHSASEDCCASELVASAGVVCGCEGDHKHLRNVHQLILLPIQLRGVDAVALVDCGATHDAVDGAFATEQGWTLEAGSVKRVKLANGGSVKSPGVLKDAEFTAGGIPMASDFVAMPMSGEEFQVILSKQWLTRVNPDVDWRNNKVVIEGIDVAAIGACGASLGGRPDAKVCSLRGVLKASRKRGSRTFLVLLRDRGLAEAGDWGGDPEGTAQAAGAQAAAKPYTPSLQRPDWHDVERNLEHHPELLSVLHEHHEVFDPLPDGPPPPTRVQHAIDLEPGAKPPFRRPYRMSPLELDELKKQIQGLLDKGWIRPSQSPYGSPVLFAAKADGSLRMCIDYRALNAVTRKSRYPLPRIDEMFDRLNGARYITCLDLQQGYHQVGVRDIDVDKTAFVTRYGQYEWLVMPFGLCNAPSTFQAMMNQLLGADFDDFVMAYLDDVTIFSRTLEEHVQHVASVLKRLRDRGYRLRLSKCKFARREVELLGFVVGQGHLKPSPKKIAVVQSWPVPTNEHELRQFLGFCNFYRRFVQGYSSLAAPLTRLFQKGVGFSWGPAQQEAFAALKDRLTSAPALLLPDMSLPFRVVVDASKFALGATLQQDHGNGWQPVAFDGRKMTSAELNYTTTDQENLGLVHALRTWRCYFEGRKVTVVTDHHALTHLLTQPNLNRRQARWVELLSNFELQIEHRPGKQNCSDPLSRLQYDAPDPDVVAMVYAIGESALDGSFLDKCRQGYANDPYYAQLAGKKRKLRHAELVQRDGLWYMGDRLCIPPDDGLKAIIFQELHDSVTGGHLGFAKTLESVTRRFFWPGLRDDVRLYVKTCPTCQRVKHSNQVPAGLQQPIPTPKFPWEQVTLDLLTSLPMTKQGHNALVVFVDRLTKMFHAEPCTVNVTAEGVAKLYLHSVVRHHGFAKTLISDRDPRFVAGFWQEVQRLLGTRVKMSTADHAQTDGQSERANRTLLQLMRSFAGNNPAGWDTLLDMAELAYNNSLQASTGKSPFYTNFGRHATMPIDLAVKPAEREQVQDLLLNIHSALAEVKREVKKSQEYQRQQANKRRRAVTYAVGDKVLVSTSIFHLKNADHHKLMPRYMGPFNITKVCGPVDVKLQLPPQLKTHPVVHVSKVRPWHETPRFGQREAQPEVVLVDGEPECVVEALLARKIVGGQVSYLVKWQGLDHCEDMWIRRSFLGNCMDLVNAYDRQFPMPTT
jgi:hypothetical protein